MFFVDRSKEPDTAAFEKHNGKASIKKMKHVREHFAAFFKGNCVYCGGKVTLDENVELDHFIPVDQITHGSFNPKEIHCCNNLVLACGICNRGQGGKHDKYPVLNPCSERESVSIHEDTALGYTIATGEFIFLKDQSGDIFQKFKASHSFINRPNDLAKRMNSYSEMNFYIRRLGAILHDEAVGWDGWSPQQKLDYIHKAQVQDYVTASDLRTSRQDLITKYIKMIETAIKDGGSFQEFTGVKRHFILNEILNHEITNPDVAEKLRIILTELSL